MRTCIANNTELQNTLKQKLQDKDALQLRDELQPVEVPNTGPNVTSNPTEEPNNAQNTEVKCDFQTSNRFETLARPETVNRNNDSIPQENVTLVKGHTDPISNFYRMDFRWSGMKFHSLEQAFQYEKAV